MKNTIILFLFILPLFAAFPPQSALPEDNISQQSILQNQFMEELKWLQEESVVSTASRREQKVSETPAAVFVISQEDIRRSGANSIPEVLRMAPGVHVARIDANKWAITMRGFNNRYADKLLVLIDGRTVYTPLFSGTYWDVQDTMLEDIERIEVIRGPGGALWGANAVNGIINIITKSAKDTQGGLFTGSAGSEERGMGGLRYGSKIGGNAYFRIYSKYFNHDDFVLESGDSANDSWESARAGFRVDWDYSSKDVLTFQGDIYTGDESERNNFRQSSDIYVSGGNLRANWKHAISDTSDMMLQIYYDRTNRITTSIEEERDTFDIDFQHSLRLTGWNEFIWGLGYRYTQNDTEDDDGLLLDPQNRENNLFSMFLQDEFSFFEDTVKVTFGTKFEHNDYTGFEIQPSLRVLWAFTYTQTVWAAVSRAVRTPSRVESDIIIDYSPYYYFTGNDDLDAENLLAYEIGYRIQFSKKLSLDIATFYNMYDSIINDVNDETFENIFDVESYGIETTLNWQITNQWRLVQSYTYFDIDSTNFTSTDPLSDPHSQFNIRSLLNLPHNMELDAALFYVDSFTSLGRNINDYVRFDVRLGWHITKYLEASLVGTNLLDDNHLEYNARSVAPTEIERAVYAKLTWRF